MNVISKIKERQVKKAADTQAKTETQRRRGGSGVFNRPYGWKMPIRRTF